jgi:hypothetical protein
LQAQRSLNDLSGPWQLFIDDSILVEKVNLTRTYHPFQKYAGNPVLVGDKPWEYGDKLPGQGIVYIYGTVLPNESGPGYRMWYACLPWYSGTAPAGASHTLYATSTDGITWTKPNLGIRTWNGSTNNNMFFDRTVGSGISSTIHTPWDPDPARRYRFMNKDPGGYWAAYSADAVHTVDSVNNPVFTGGSDVGQFMWDPFNQIYRGYVKNGWMDWNGLQRRAVALTQTTNIESWPTEQLILTPDPIDDRWSSNPVYRTHFYGLSAFAYESMYLGLLWIFRASDAEGYFVGPVYAEIISSRDGVHWTREEGNRPAILALGPSGTWDDGQLYTATQPLVEGDTVKLYYGACDQPHGSSLKTTICAIGLSTLRKDGFASLDAGATAGSVITQSLLGAAGTLRVNCTASAGSVRVEVLDRYNTVLPGYGAAECAALTGTGIDQAVTWASHSELPSVPEPIRLRFIVQNASLYSFRAAEPVQLAWGPVISDQPDPLAICLGNDAIFSVQASGYGTLLYQWQKDGSDLTDGGNISGTNQSQLEIASVGPGDLGAYRCVVSDEYGSTPSLAASLSLGATTIIQQPTPRSIEHGQSASFSVAATGAGTLTYQWQKELTDLDDGGHYSGVHTPILTISSANASDTGKYRCVVTGDCGIASSDEVMLTVAPPQAACLRNAFFEEGFSAGVAHHWTRFNLSGSVTCAATTDARSGAYAQRVYSSNGANTGGIYQQVSVTPGQSYTFSVYVRTSNANVMEGYLGIDPNGGINYNAVPAQYKDFTSYTTWSQQRVTVIPTGNTVTVFLYARSARPSTPGYVYFDDAAPDCSTIPPVIMQQPVNQVVCAGRNAEFTVVADGAAPLSYQWQKNAFELENGEAYTGVTTTTLTVNAADAADVADYRCVVTNTNGTATSNAASLAVHPRVASDLDGDCDVDRPDFDLFADCMSGANVPCDPSCTSRDFDEDGDVDQSDFALLQRCFSGSAILPDPVCAE